MQPVFQVVQNKLFTDYRTLQEKYQPLKKTKVNKKCQAISQLLKNELSLSVSLKRDEKYKDGKQFKLLHSSKHFMCTA